MSRRIGAESMTRLAAEIFRALGAPTDDADLTAEHLVTSSLMGCDSHGVLRIPEYVDLVEDGSIAVGGAIDVQRTSNTTALVDCGRNFGPVGATRAIGTGVEIAKREKVACVVTRQCNHIARVGAYPQFAAEQGVIAIATCNSPMYGHFVLPWGGREGRLATNPIAYAVPSGKRPILADFSTSVAPEGKVRFHKNQDKPVPEGWIVDAEGAPTTDPARFYGPPRGGILPLGGSAGHKGYALGLLVELLGAPLAGLSSIDTTTVGNGVCFLLIDPSAFVPIDRFRELVDESIRYMKSSAPAPGFEEVLVPGDLEFRAFDERSRSGIPLDPVTWEAIGRCASRLNVTMPESTPT